MTDAIHRPPFVATDCRTYHCLYLEVTDEEGWAITQCLKRAGLSHYRQLAVDDNEAYCMRTAAKQLLTALATIGFAPR
jgi:hypothetical protein